MNISRRMLFMLVISCLPLLILMIPIGDKKIMDLVTSLSEDSDILVEGFCFLFTAAILLIGSHMAKKKTLRDQVNARDAVAIGFGQMLAASFPGISRSGTTISTGLICGVSKDYMVKYSFILGIPAILAANVMEFSKAFSTSEAIDIFPCIIGILTAAIFGIIAIKALQWIVKKDHLNKFGYYCLVIGLIVIIMGIYEHTTGNMVTINI